MAKNNTPAVKPAENKKKIDGTNLFLIIFAAVALVGIITALVLGIVSYAAKRPVDYMNDNLGKFVSLKESDYKSFDVLVNLDPVTDATVENEIIKILYKNRKETDGKNNIGQTIKVGDTANIYYFGYTLDDEGNKVPFDGGCNFGSSVTALGIGSGQMIPGFELALVGKNSADYATMTKKDSGTVEDGNLVYITYTVAYFDGTAKKDVTAMVDLSTDVDATWGEGFKNYLIGATVGKKIEGSLTIDRTSENGTKQSDTYSDVTVTRIIEFSEGEPLTIDVKFPRPYTSSPALEGKAVKFDIYIVTSVSYDTPEFNDAFITDTLKVEADTLKDYEGATLAEKYKAMIRKGLEETYAANVDKFIEDAYWLHLLKVAKVKKLPESEVNNFYRGHYAEVENYYASYSSYFKTLDEAARQYLGLSTGADWQAELMRKSASEVTEKILFYYIIREEGLIPSDEVYKEMYDKAFNAILDNYLKQYGVEREDYETDEEYEKQVDVYRSVVESTYGEDYFRESVYFDYAMDTFRTYANITYAQ